MVVWLGQLSEAGSTAGVTSYPFFSIADTVAYAAPLGYTFGRLGNFINGELFGRVSTKPWAMIFPDAPSFSTNYAWVREIADQVGISYQSGAMVNLPSIPASYMKPCSKEYCFSFSSGL